jgi:hypothetical protein
MRNYIVAAFAAPLILLWSSIGYCQDTESALGDPTPAAVQDPKLSNSRYFPPSLGTSGVAAIGPSRPSGPAAKSSHVASCSATNPCATPSPARDRVVVAQSQP